MTFTLAQASYDENVRLERFFSKIDASSWFSCWRWRAALNVAGYGLFTGFNRPGLAHRFAYEHAVGPIPPGYVIDHVCRTRSCVNPRHLEAVTNQENVLRGKAGRLKPSVI